MSLTLPKKKRKHRFSNSRDDQKAKAGAKENVKETSIFENVNSECGTRFSKVLYLF